MKNKTIILFVFLALSISACSFKLPGSSDLSKNPTDAIKEAITGGKSMKCTFEEEGKTITSYIMGKKSKVMGMNFTDNGEGGMINDGTWVYMWGADKKGTKYQLSVLEEMNKDNLKESPNNQDLSNKPSSFDIESWTKEQETKAKYECSPAILTNNDFVPPSDVVFQDITDTFVKMNEFSKKMEENPDQVPTEQDMENLNQLMKDAGGAFGGSQTPTDSPEEQIEE